MSNVTPDTLTPDQVRSLNPRCDEWIEWPNKHTYRLGWYLWDALHSQHEHSRTLARQICCSVLSGHTNPQEVRP